MNAITQHSGVAGFFKADIVSLDETGNPIPGSERSTGWFPNLITNNGLNRLASSQFLAVCSIGTGNTVPAVTDTALAAYHAQKTASAINNGPTNAGEGWVSAVATYPFAQGAVVGNMQEIGIGPSNTNLLSRALITDAGGSPTVLVVTAIDQLTVYYQLREYPRQTDQVSTVTDGATSYTVTSRTANGLNANRVAMWNTFGPSAGFGDNWRTSANAYTGVLGAWTSSPGGADMGQTALSNQPYSTDSHSLVVSGTFGTTLANGSIKSVYISANYPLAAQMEFDPPIVKNNTQTLTITVVKSWARHTP